MQWLSCSIYLFIYFSTEDVPVQTVRSTYYAVCTIRQQLICENSGVPPTATLTHYILLLQ